MTGEQFEISFGDEISGGPDDYVIVLGLDTDGVRDIFLAPVSADGYTGEDELGHEVTIDYQSDEVNEQLREVGEPVGAIAFDSLEALVAHCLDHQIKPTETIECWCA